MGTRTAIIQTILGRLILLFHSLGTAIYAVTLKKRRIWGVLGSLSVIQVAECVYTCYYRRGYEYKCLSMSSTCYLLSVIPSMWVIKLHVLYEVKDNEHDGNYTIEFVERLAGPLGRHVVIEVLSQTMLLSIIMHRWVIPRGPLTRNRLSELLFILFTFASDIMTFLGTTDDKALIGNVAMTYSILLVWSISLFLMAFVHNVTRDTFAIVRALAMESSSDAERGSCASCGDVWSYITATEVWSLLLTVFFLDGPYLGVRVYLIAELQMVTYGIIFFAVKNVVVLAITVYRLIVVGCTTQHEDESDAKQKVPACMRRKKDGKVTASTSRTSQAPPTSPSPSTAAPRGGGFPSHASVTSFGSVSPSGAIPRGGDIPRGVDIPSSAVTSSANLPPIGAIPRGGDIPSSAVTSGGNLPRQPLSGANLPGSRFPGGSQPRPKMFGRGGRGPRPKMNPRDPFRDNII